MNLTLTGSVPFRRVSGANESEGIQPFAILDERQQVSSRVQALDLRPKALVLLSELFDRATERVVFLAHVLTFVFERFDPLRVSLQPRRDGSEVWSSVSV